MIMQKYWVSITGTQAVVLTATIMTVLISFASYFTLAKHTKY